ncbi:YdcF family protein [Bradyrhizobium sp. 45]|uniref:YdcF family protein n=1 Tax=Bradyrhizobium sp. 45 TaxID=1043587 RepID=UPI001FFC2188|nr:YdcF family protein [Bradyrhizobium sp. 45]MCK1305741.1 YdcF family protein [Bradyrhizobium sp. 45]
MYFFLSKTVGELLTPSTFIVAIASAGLLLIVCRWSVLGGRLLVLSSILLVLCGLSPLGYWLLQPLESRFPDWDESRGSPAGVIVLGGSIDPALSAARGAAVFPAGADRLVAAAELGRRYPNIPIIFTGGSANLTDGAREADFAVGIFARLGLPTERIVIERESRNTFENAKLVKAITVPKPGEHWLLVTSAYHMPRAVASFRAAGFFVEPYPVDWLTPGLAHGNLIDRPFYGLRRTDRGLHEWVGLFADWVSGRNKELFPAYHPSEIN